MTAIITDNAYRQSQYNGTKSEWCEGVGVVLHKLSLVDTSITSHISSEVDAVGRRRADI